jgi:hypothetical protein
MARGRAGRIAMRAGAVLMAVLLAACGGGSYDATVWDGRRGYDGNGDYGYDLAASRAEARGYRMRASRAYAVPGTPDDPWGPHIREAARRFGVPEQWIREVMRQETGGRLYGSDGLPITSPAGAMGLMQVMPRTFDALRARYALGSDPYEPRDNILAGAAYIREMHDRFGAPAFLAAYNAGPDRLDAVLAGITILPDETVNYLANVAPRLGMGTMLTGPFAPYGGFATAVYRRPRDGNDLAYAGGGMTGAQYFGSPVVTRIGASLPRALDDGDLAYAGGGMTGAQYFGATPAARPDDPSLRAFEGGGLVTPYAPTGTLTRPLR